MNEIICPECKKAFKIDEAGYAEILKQVHNSEFENELQKRLKDADKEKYHAVEKSKKDSELELQKLKTEKALEIENLKSSHKSRLQENEREKESLQHQLRFYAWLWSRTKEEGNVQSLEGWYLSSKERIDYKAPSKEELAYMDEEFRSITETMRNMGEGASQSWSILPPPLGPLVVLLLIVADPTKSLLLESGILSRWFYPKIQDFGF